MVRRALPHRCGNHPLGEIVDLLEALSPRDREAPGAPQELERGLAEVPVPPAAARPGPAFGEVARHDRALLANQTQHPLELILVLLAAPAAKAPLDRLTLALEAQLPLGIEADRQDRGDIVGPVLEQPHLVLERAPQQLWPIARA